MVERELTLCELHNRDVCILCGWSNFRKKSCVFVPLILIYFLLLFKFCSYLEFDLTLDLNPKVYVAFSCFRYFSKLYIVYFANSKLIGTKRHHPDSRSTYPLLEVSGDRAYPV
jgi:uncharacterized membrane protein